MRENFKQLVVAVLLFSLHFACQAPKPDKQHSAFDKGFFLDNFENARENSISVEIKGRIQIEDPRGSLLLAEFGAGKYGKVAEATINPDSTFEFKTSVKHPGIYAIIPGVQYGTRMITDFSDFRLPIIITKPHKSTVNIDWGNKQNISIQAESEEGSLALGVQKEIYVLRQENLEMENNWLKVKSGEVQQFSVLGMQYEKAYDRALIKMNNYIKDKISDTDVPYIKLFLLDYLGTEDDHHHLLTICHELRKQMPDSRALNLLLHRLYAQNDGLLFHKFRDFSGTTLQGQDFVLSEAIQGRKALLVFFVSWCEFCKIEMERYKTLADKYRKEGLLMIGVSMDMDKELLKSNLQTSDVPWDYVITTPGGFHSKIPMIYDVKMVPGNLSIDESGVVQAMNLREDEFESFYSAAFSNQKQSQ